MATNPAVSVLSLLGVAYLYVNNICMLQNVLYKLCFCSKRYSGSESLILLMSVIMKSVLQEFLCLARDLNTANFL